MRILKSHPLLKMVNSYVIDSPTPSNISYLWNFGSLLGFCLVIQIVTGVTLGMHYTPNVLEAFDSVEHIMRDVNNGWLIRYLHSNTASAFFFIVYLHIGRGLYYGSYRAPRTLVWTIGTVIFILMMATAFLGYVLPYGQMSLWGATVITNLMSAIPWVGQDIVEFIWGGFSVNNATLNRFFALHFVLPFILAALALMHLIALHDSSGSGNPLGVSANYDRLPFSPYFLFKDLITIFIFIIILSVFVFFMPNVLGDSENYVMANPMQTPPAIVPEWYLLPFYAILRSIPNKLLGVIAMFSAILALLCMPYTDLSRLRGIQFRPLSKIAFFLFIANFLILMQLGAKHVESPFIELGQISTALYFAHFLVIVPMVTLIENSLVDLATNEKSKYTIDINNIFIIKIVIGISLFYILTLVGLVFDLYGIQINKYIFKSIKYVASSVIILFFKNKLTVHDIIVSLLLKCIGLSSWFSIGSLLGYTSHNIMPEPVEQGEAGVRRNGRFGVVIPDTQAWRIEVSHWFTGVNWGVSENNPYINREDPNRRVNAYFLAYGHYTNEERLDLTNSIRTKLMQNRRDFTEKEVGCIKYICRRDIGFIHFAGGSNDEPIINGINPNKILSMLGQDASKRRLIDKMSLENNAILSEVARINRNTSLTNIMN